MRIQGPQRCSRVVKVHSVFGKEQRNAAHKANACAHINTNIKNTLFVYIHTHIYKVKLKKCLVNGYILLGAVKVQQLLTPFHHFKPTQG